jgi:hypothetical protein
VTKTPRRRGRLTKNPADPQASSAKRQDRRKIGAGRPSGQVVRIGPGLDTINPLDAGAGTLLRQLTSEAARLRQELRSRRLSLLMALATPIREARLSSTEEVIPGRATDLLHERGNGQAEPSVTDVLAVIEKGPDALRPAARASTAHRHVGRVFDGGTSQPIDPERACGQRGHFGDPCWRGRAGQRTDRGDAVHLELRAWLHEDVALAGHDGPVLCVAISPSVGHQITGA